MRRLAAVRSGEIERFPAAIAGGEDGVVGVGGVDLDVKEPVNGRGLDVGRESVIVLAAAAEDGLPRGACVGGAEDVFAAGGTGAAEAADDERAWVRGINGDGCVAKFLFAGGGMVGGDVGPLAGAGVQLPHCAIGHAGGAWGGAVGDVEESVAGERGAGGAVFGGLAGDGLPGCAAVVGREEIRLVHERDADIEVLRGGGFRVCRIEPDENDAASANGHAPPALLGGFARSGSGHGGRGFGNVRKAGDAGPGCAAVLRPPEPVVTGSEIEDAAVVGIDGETLAIA